MDWNEWTGMVEWNEWTGMSGLEWWNGTVEPTLSLSSMSKVTYEGVNIVSLSSYSD